MDTFGHSFYEAVRLVLIGEKIALNPLVISETMSRLSPLEASAWEKFYALKADDPTKSLQDEALLAESKVRQVETNEHIIGESGGEEDDDPTQILEQEALLAESWNRQVETNEHIIDADGEDRNYFPDDIDDR